MEVVDETTLRFNLGSPQPLFLAAMASSYGPMVISPTALAENASEDDPYAHEWAKASPVVVPTSSSRTRREGVTPARL